MSEISPNEEALAAWEGEGGSVPAALRDPSRWVVTWRGSKARLDGRAWVPWMSYARACELRRSRASVTFARCSSAMQVRQELPASLCGTTLIAARGGYLI